MNIIKSKVAGTSFRSFNWDHIQAGQTLEVVREPDNPHDSNAMALYHFDPDLQCPVQVGYISKYQAAKLAAWMDDPDEQVSVSAVVTEVTGGEPGKANRGINIEIRVSGVDSKQYFDMGALYFGESCDAQSA